MISCAPNRGAFFVPKTLTGLATLSGFSSTCQLRLIEWKLLTTSNAGNNIISERWREGCFREIRFEFALICI